MGTGWRRSFCTSIPRDPETEKQQQSPPSRSCVKLGIFSGGGGGGGSNPSTPRLQSQGSTPKLRCRTKSAPSDSPITQCKTTQVCTPPSSDTTAKGSPRLFQTLSNPSSPRTPSRFALLKATLRLSRSRCGICARSLGSGKKTAVFTAECSHAFHFPCISAHVSSQGCLACPVCSSTWHQVPLLSTVNPAAAAPPQNDDHLVAEENRGPHKKPNKDDKNRREDEGESKAPPIKIYNDDEPLLPSNVSRGSSLMHFNPIPEAEDEDDADGEEGEEGYSPLPLSPSSARCIALKGSGGDGGRGTVVEVNVMPEAVALVSAGRSHQNYVVKLKLKAPSLLPPGEASVAAAVPANLLDPSCRAPIDLVTVLDVSGSMTTAKLQMLKRAMRLVISSLGPADRLSMVAFSASAAKRLLPLRRMSRQGQRAARQIVDRLVVCNGSQGHRGSSCVGDALRKATKVLEDRRERNPVATIMLLSDGHGQTQQEQQQQHHDTTTTGGGRSNQSVAAATRFTHIEIPIHASGGVFGGAAAAQQRSRHPTPVAVEDDAFAKCVKGLVSVVLHDVHLQFVFPSGVIFSVYSYAGGGGGIVRPVAHGEGGNSVRIGDLYAEEERELLVELRVPAAAAAAAIDGGHQIMSVKCSYRDPATREVVHCDNRPLLIQFPPPKLQSQSPHSSNSNTSSTKNAAQRQLKDLFVTTRAMAESRRLVDLNDLETAFHLLSSARSLLLMQQHSTSNSSHNQLVLTLEAELSDLQWRRRRQQQQQLSPSHQRRIEQALLPAEGGGGGGLPLTPTSAWRAAEQLAKVAIMRKSLNRVSDLHGLENARF